MIILKELGMSLFLGIACAGVLTLLFTNNLSIWYKTAKTIKENLKQEKKKRKKDMEEI
ncbi:hypothetical protein LI064_15810 [Clostridium perfringens]|uniref:hypothetical protein n=1 Tax=Clostridium perfringens TaxID=1502 RepID=UPI002245D7F5|nr:hypothetical protein [Clostridium perfringens]MCX0355981.1 hypothetical protein [Clostridium perfringens]MDM0612646.1 hypothetical protein [Clostridium perfringens]